MKVVLQTSDRLVLRSRPWLLAAIIGGLLAVLLLVVAAKLAAGNRDEAGKAGMVAGLMAVAFVVLVREDVVSLDRRAGEVVIVRRSVFGRSGTRLALEDIRTARMESDPDGSKSGKPLARPVLVDAGGKVVPLRSSHTVDPADEAAVKAIRAWLTPQGRAKTRRG